jgi:hypothetical protein
MPANGLSGKTHLIFYPFLAVPLLGKFTHFWYGNFWVNVFGKTPAVLRLDIAGVFMKQSQ